MAPPPAFSHQWGGLPALLDGLAIRTTLSAMATSRRVALYVRLSTSDRGQTVENQLQPPHEAAPDGLVGILNRIFR